MKLVNIVLLLFCLWPVAELIFARLRMARRDETDVRDRGTFGLLWAMFAVAIALGFLLQSVPAPRIPIALEPRAILAFVLYVAGLALRISAIVVLGRFFTVNVALHSGQSVVRAGPYRWIRHPSYAGALISFLGIAILPGSWLTVAVIMIPITLTFLHRIRVEEKALMDGLGEPYREYCRTTRRLIPGVY
jgi:protein-S-isoprenylcysteine O-methyltransferase